MTKEQLLKLGEEIKSDFELIISKDISGYEKGGRYKELIAMLNELRNGNLKPGHEDFDYTASMDTDELTIYPTILNKVTRFTDNFQKLFSNMRKS